jgi:hypothetical protein
MRPKTHFRTKGEGVQNYYKIQSKKKIWVGVLHHRTGVQLMITEGYALHANRADVEFQSGVNYWIVIVYRVQIH